MPDTSQNHFLTFKVKNDTYAIPIASIREILAYSNITTIPLSPDYIDGILNLRGNVIPVIDIATRFGFESTVKTETTCIIINEIQTEEGVMEFGMVVDDVNNTIQIDHQHLMDSPSFGAKIRADFIEGIGKINDDFIVIIKLDTVFSLEELTIEDDKAVLQQIA